MTYKNKLLALFIVSLLSVTCAIKTAHSQTVTPLKFSISPSIKLNKAMYQALSDKIKQYSDKYGGSGLYLYHALADVNNDNKPEVFVQFREEYDFRDRFGNVDTHVFSQTSKGLVEILNTQVSEISLGDLGNKNIRRIVTTKRPNTKKQIVFEWNGKNKYKEVK